MEIESRSLGFNKNRRQVNVFLYAQMRNYESINDYIVNETMRLYSTLQVSYFIFSQQLKEHYHDNFL